MNEITRRNFITAVVAGLALPGRARAARPQPTRKKMIMSSSRRKLVVHPQTEAEDFATRVTSAGGSLSAGQLAAVNRFIRDLKAGDVWNMLQDCGLFLGNGLSAALVKLKYSSGNGLLTNFGFVSGDFNAGVGLTGDGSTNYLATGFTPGLDWHLAAYRSAAAGATRSYDIGADDRYLGAVSGDELASFETSAELVLDDVASEFPKGLRIINATGGRRQFLLNGNLLSDQVAAAPAAVGQSLFVFGRNVEELDGPSEASLGFYSAGYGLSAAHAAALWSAVLELMTTLGRPLPS